MWILIIMATIYGDGITINQVSGFTSEKYCTEAGNNFITKQDRGGLRITTHCMKVK